MAWGATIAAGASALGNWISGKGGIKAQKELMGKQAKINRRMYIHRYQWAMEDLRKAGLNPILAAGSSQPVPQGVSAGDVTDAGGALGRGLANSAMTALQAKQTQVNTANTAQNTKTQEEDEFLKRSQRGNVEYDNDVKVAQRDAIVADKELKQASAKAVHQQALKTKQDMELDKKYRGTEGGAFGLPKDLISGGRDWIRQHETSARKVEDYYEALGD